MVGGEVGDDCGARRDGGDDVDVMVATFLVMVTASFVMVAISLAMVTTSW